MRKIHNAYQKPLSQILEEQFHNMERFTVYRDSACIEFYYKVIVSAINKKSEGAERERLLENALATYRNALMRTSDLWKIRADDERNFAIGKAQAGNREGALYHLGREEHWLSMYKGSRPDLLEAFGLDFKRIMQMAERVYYLKRERPEYRNAA